MLDRSRARLVQRLIDDGPHQAARRQWWWPTVMDLQRAHLVLVRVTGRGDGVASLCWTQRGRQEADALMARP